MCISSLGCSIAPLDLLGKKILGIYVFLHIFLLEKSAVTRPLYQGLLSMTLTET